MTTDCPLLVIMEHAGRLKRFCTHELNRHPLHPIPPVVCANCTIRPLPSENTHPAPTVEDLDAIEVPIQPPQPGRPADPRAKPCKEPCAHLGPRATNADGSPKRIRCNTGCAKALDLKQVYQCEVHGECLRDRGQQGIHGCAGCGEYAGAPPFSGPFVRNLLMHIYPVAGRGVWQWNVAQILRHMDQFNGRRVVAVATGPETDSFEAVKDAFQGTVTEFLHVENNPDLGEVVSFLDLLKSVRTTEPDQITFYCHAKGVKYEPDDPKAPYVRRWSEAMYSTLLDYPDLVDEALRTKPVAGAFLKLGQAFKDHATNWHFRGTFYWFRNAAVFSTRTWDKIPQSYHGSEIWPALICPRAKDAAALLMTEDKQFGPLYQKDYWDRAATPKWTRWQREHAAQRRHSRYADVLRSLRAQSASQVIVTGPQRSGTTIAAKMLADDLGLPFFAEEEFDTHDAFKFFELLRRKPEFVIQAPTMAAHAHLTPAHVIFMRRGLEAIQASEKRIGWHIHEQTERERYFNRTGHPAATIKTEAWEFHQRIALGSRAYDLDYESLQGHPLWVDQESRANFHERQTSV